MPTKFAEKQYDSLREAIGDSHLVTVSRLPMPGHNLIDTETPGYLNIYRQMLRAAKEVTTEYVAIAEDDCFYHKSHFALRPKSNSFLYNQHRWALFTWDAHMYSWRDRVSNCTLIAPRLLLIDALQERFAKWGDAWPEQHIGELGRERVERGLGVTVRPMEIQYSKIAVVQFNHEHAHEERQRRQRKSFGNICANSIPFWGDSVNLNTWYE